MVPSLLFVILVVVLLLEFVVDFITELAVSDEIAVMAECEAALGLVTERASVDIVWSKLLPLDVTFAVMVSSELPVILVGIP